MKIEIHIHILQENFTTNFSTQDNNESTVPANSTTDNSSTNNKINRKATGKQQTSTNGTLHNEQTETNNSTQRDNLNSF